MYPNAHFCVVDGHPSVRSRYQRSVICNTFLDWREHAWNYEALGIGEIFPDGVQFVEVGEAIVLSISL